MNNSIETSRDRQREGVKVRDANPNDVSGCVPISFLMGEARTIIYVDSEKVAEFGEQYFIDKYQSLSKIKKKYGDFDGLKKVLGAPTNT